MAEAPVAWVPLGALEFHAQHLPFGTDGFTAQAVVERAARQVGGVVLPWSALTMGTLSLDWSFRYEPALVEAALRSTIEQLADPWSAGRGRPHRTWTPGSGAPHQACLR